jgi:hypothetical protein
MHPSHTRSPGDGRRYPRARRKLATILLTTGLLAGGTAVADAHQLSWARAYSEAKRFNHAVSLRGGASGDGVRDCTRNDSHEFVCVVWTVWPDQTGCTDTVRVYFPNESSFSPRVATTPEPPVCR